MFALTSAGFNAFDLHTARGAYCGTIAKTKTGAWRVFFNMTATKGSARKFASAEEAVKFVHARRIKKGWSV
jgi:hypothetical protein